MSRLIFIDFETTGLSYREDCPTELGILETDLEGNVISEYESLIKLPKGKTVPKFITDLTGITTEKLEVEGKEIEEVKKEIEGYFTGDELVIAHHASFDLGFLKGHFDIEPNNFMCTRVAWSDFERESASLQNIYNRHFGQKIQEHRALEDVYMLKLIYFKWKQLNKGNKDIQEYVNILKEMEGRKLDYVPYNALVL